MAKSKKIRVRLKAYDHKILDLSVEKIVAAANNSGAKVVGPIPLHRKTGLHDSSGGSQVQRCA